MNLQTTTGGLFMKETYTINMLERIDIRRDKDLMKNKKPNINGKAKVDP